MPPQPKRQHEPLQRESDYGEPFRPYGVAILIVVILGVIGVLYVSRSGTSCSGEQNVEAFTGDNLTVLILSNVDGARDSSVPLEGIIALVTEDQPELNKRLEAGKTVTLPKTCSGNSFSSSWDRGQ